MNYHVAFLSTLSNKNKKETIEDDKVKNAMILSITFTNNITGWCRVDCRRRMADGLQSIYSLHTYSDLHFLTEELIGSLPGVDVTTKFSLSEVTT